MTNRFYFLRFFADELIVQKPNILSIVINYWLKKTFCNSFTKGNCSIYGKKGPTFFSNKNFPRHCSSGLSWVSWLSSSSFHVIQSMINTSTAKHREVYQHNDTDCVLFHFSILAEFPQISVLNLFLCKDYKYFLTTKYF